jgi:hypothetical protein
VEFYNFFRLMLAVILTVTLAWPLNIPLVALAYKVRQGQAPNPLEPRAFWLRCTFASLGLLGLSLVLLGADVLLAKVVELPAGPVHLILFMAYLPVAVWYLFVLFALEDLLQALSLFLLYVFLVGMPLLFIDQVLDFWQPLEPARNVLVRPT